MSYCSICITFFLIYCKHSVGYLAFFKKFSTQHRHLPYRLPLLCQVSEELELAKVFCRLADDYLLLDVEGAGIEFVFMLQKNK
jgi:hypothetical protein